MQFLKNSTWHFESPPNPTRSPIILYHLNLADSPQIVRDDGIEILRMLDREQQKTQLPVGQRGQTILRKPNRVWETNNDVLVFAQDRRSTKERVTKAGRVR